MEGKILFIQLILVVIYSEMTIILKRTNHEPAIELQCSWLAMTDSKVVIIAGLEIELK